MWINLVYVWKERWYFVLSYDEDITHSVLSFIHHKTYSFILKTEQLYLWLSVERSEWLALKFNKLHLLIYLPVLLWILKNVFSEDMTMHWVFILVVLIHNNLAISIPEDTGLPCEIKQTITTWTTDHWGIYVRL